MWARRCGAPATWPSRVKVFLFSIATAAIGLTIYTFMASSDVGYLDLARPSPSPVLCLDHWPLHNELSSWFDQGSWDAWFEYQSGVDEYRDRHAQCSQTAWQANGTCSSISVPLHHLLGSLGAPLEFQQEESTSSISDVLKSRDVLGIYAHLFLILSICLWCAISFHDHALLHSTSKDYILDVIALRRDFPRLKTAWVWLLGWRLLRRLLRHRRSYLGFAVLPLVALLTPALLVWRLLVFMFVVVPSAGVVFLCYPIRTSRLWTLLISLAAAVYGICLSVHMSFLLAAPAERPRYAVTWQAGQCICGCVYPVSHTTCGRLLMIGLLAVVKASVIAFRTLKGLRRSNWANLMSVTFAVPVNAYAVEWKQPDGLPIRFREAGDPVQSELAFDPFAMMDEQPESANSHVTLRPTSVLRREVDERSGATKWRRSSSRRLQGPSIPSVMTMEVDEHERVGCCGFPLRTRRSLGHAPALDDLERAEEARTESSPHQAACGQEEEEEQDEEAASQHPLAVLQRSASLEIEGQKPSSPMQSRISKEDSCQEQLLELRRSAAEMFEQLDRERTSSASPVFSVEGGDGAKGFALSPASEPSMPLRLPRIGLPLGSPTDVRSRQPSRSPMKVSTCATEDFHMDASCSPAKAQAAACVVEDFHMDAPSPMVKVPLCLAPELCAEASESSAKVPEPAPAEPPPLGPERPSTGSVTTVPRIGSCSTDCGSEAKLRGGSPATFLPVVARRAAEPEEPGRE